MRASSSSSANREVEIFRSVSAEEGVVGVERSGVLGRGDGCAVVVAMLASARIRLMMLGYSIVDCRSHNRCVFCTLLKEERGGLLGSRWCCWRAWCGLVHHRAHKAGATGV